MSSEISSSELTEEQKVELAKPQRKPTREERRLMERADAEAQKSFALLSAKLKRFVLEEDDITEIQKYAEMLNRKWIFVCNDLHLIPQARVVFSDWSKGIIDAVKIGDTIDQPESL